MFEQQVLYLLFEHLHTTCITGPDPVRKRSTYVVCPVLTHYYEDRLFRRSTIPKVRVRVRFRVRVSRPGVSRVMVSRVIGLGLVGLGLVLLRNSGPAEWWILGIADRNRRSHVFSQPW